MARRLHAERLGLSTHGKGSGQARILATGGASANKAILQVCFLAEWFVEPSMRRVFSRLDVLLQGELYEFHQFSPFCGYSPRSDRSS